MRSASITKKEIRAILNSFLYVDSVNIESTFVGLFRNISIAGGVLEMGADAAPAGNMTLYGAITDDYLKWDSAIDVLKIRTKQGAGGTSYAALSVANRANASNYADIFGAQIYCQLGAQTRAGTSGFAAGFYCQISGGGVDTAQRYALWIDDICSTTAGEAHYMMRISKNDITASIDGVFTVANNHKMDVLFNFEQDGATVGCIQEHSSTLSAGSTDAGRIVIRSFNGTLKYLQLYTA